MKITTVLFDLDGTLLPMEQEDFVKVYFSSLAKKLAPYGYESEKLVASIWAGTKQMVMNDGKVTNEKAFWNKFCEIYGEDAIKDEPIFAEFYKNEFNNVKSICGFNEGCVKAVKIAKEKGLRVVLATNPIFPAVATESRIRWAGLDTSDFELYTTYENSSFCKPNLNYYKEIISNLGVNPEECLMVGNDISEDMVAKNLGMRVFLLTDHIINKEKTDINLYPNGNVHKLIEYIEKL